MRKPMNSLLDNLREKIERRVPSSGADADSRDITRCQEGDLAAFEGLVERYMSLAVRTAMGYMRNHDEAVDCSQDAFVKMLESLPRFDNSQLFLPWFYRILRNTCLNRLRQSRFSRETSIEAVE